MSTTPTLEPAIARRFANQLKLLDGKTLQGFISLVENWKTQAEQKHLELTQRANGGANNLRRAVAAWDEALPALQQAIEAAKDRLAGSPPSEVPPEPATTAIATPTATAQPVPETGDAPPAEAAAPAEPPAAAKPKAPKVAKKPKAAKPAKPKSLSGLDAAAQILRKAKEPLDANELVKRILEQGLWTTKGKTPASTIYAAIIREIHTKGSSARFRKVARGRFEAAS
jgi:hypothetical protein